MHSLPRRVKELPIPIPGCPGVVVHAEPLTDEQYLVINEGAVLQYVDGPDGERVKRYAFPLSPHVEFFRDRLRSISELDIAGEPFDPANDDHVASIPATWKAAVLQRLVRYAQGLTEEELGNSLPPAETSSTDTTSSPT
ncbi:hypothetical protein [Longimicrobium sp.]|jgi:hypothetical protein|uniref:hypothetical protein n=1 Tax=Longimicrobium sp. TaxID=2029185 RepID=UPI002ED8BB92